MSPVAPRDICGISTQVAGFEGIPSIATLPVVPGARAMRLAWVGRAVTAYKNSQLTALQTICTLNEYDDEGAGGVPIAGSAGHCYPCNRLPH